jgi:hypothetical protein
MTAMSETAVPKSGSSRISVTRPPTIRDRQQRVLEFVDARAAALQHQRREQDGGDLGQLGRLNAESADAEPSAGAVDRPREQHRDQQQPDHAQQQPDHPVVAIGAVIDAHDDRQDGDANRGPHHLARHEQIRLLKALQRHQRRRAVDHDHAGANQGQRRQEQPLVRLQFPRHTPVFHRRRVRGALKFRDVHSIHRVRVARPP